MLIYLVIALFFGIPAIALIACVISMVDFVSASRKTSAHPGTFSSEEMKKKRTRLIYTSTLAAMLLSVVVGVTVMFYMAIAHM